MVRLSLLVGSSSGTGIVGPTVFVVAGTALAYRTPMFLTGLATATPPRRYTKADCWEAFLRSPWAERLGPRARFVVQAVLERENGMEARRLAVDSLDEVFAIDADVLQARFATHAPALGSRAAQDALADAGLDASRIGALVVSTCTGYLCPALSGYLVERMGLPPQVQCFDLVGQGCAAALPNWQLAEALIASGRHEHVLSVCVEVCSAAMYLDEDPGVLVSACLFGDGAGAAVLSRDAPAGRRPVRWVDSASLMDPSEREALRFEHRGGLLRNILTRAVPRLAAERAHALLGQVTDRAGRDPRDIAAWIVHAGGRDVLSAVGSRFGLPDAALAHSAAMLREYGNLSSAFVYFVLQEALRAEAPAGDWWMTSFGAGFACHGALLEVG
jgi:alkylresorcinol/alkylpyrone synthase